MEYDSIYGNNGWAVYSEKADTNIVVAGNMLTNSCWTIAGGLSDGDAATRIAIGGIVGSNVTCLRTIVDGYTLSGTVVVGRAGDTYTNSHA